MTSESHRPYIQSCNSCSNGLIHVENGASVTMAEPATRLDDGSVIDIEADGPIPGDYSMVCLGAVIVEPELQRTFYGRLRPISLMIPQ